MTLSPGYKNTYVGRFYEELAKDLLGGKLTRDKRGDLFIPEIRATVEVKASGERSNYGFRVCLNQLRQYTSRVESGESSHVWYVLCFYRNRDVRLPGGRKTTEFARHHTNRQVRRFLRQRTRDVYILDLTVMQHIVENTPTSLKSIIGHLGRKTVDIKRRFLKSVLTGEACLPNEVKLARFDPSSFTVHIVGQASTHEIIISRVVRQF